MGPSEPRTFCGGKAMKSADAEGLFSIGKYSLDTGKRSE